MSKSSKSEALKKHLGNVVCTECGSKKHKTKEHGKEKKHKEEEHEEGRDEEINGDEE